MYLKPFLFFCFFNAELAVLDPPYGLTTASWDVKPWDKEDFCRVFKQVFNCSMNPQMCFITFCSFQQYACVVQAFKESGWSHPRVIVWHKTNKAFEGGRRFPNRNELLVFAWKDSIAEGVWNYGPRDTEKDDLWLEPAIGNGFFLNDDGSKVNETQKPRGLLLRLLRHHSNPGAVVLDLCAGSHSLMMACLWSGRSCISVELDKAQHIAALRRFRMEQKDFHQFLLDEQLKEDEEEEEEFQVLEGGEVQESEGVEENPEEMEITQALAAGDVTPGTFKAGHVGDID